MTWQGQLSCSPCTTSSLETSASWLTRPQDAARQSQCHLSPEGACDAGDVPRAKNSRSSLVRESLGEINFTVPIQNTTSAFPGSPSLFVLLMLALIATHDPQSKLNYARADAKALCDLTLTEGAAVCTTIDGPFRCPKKQSHAVLAPKALNPKDAVDTTAAVDHLSHRDSSLTCLMRVSGGQRRPVCLANMMSCSSPIPVL